MKKITRPQFYVFTLLCFLPLALMAQTPQKDWQWIKRGGSTYPIPNAEMQESVYDMATDSQQNIYVVSTVGMFDIDVDEHSLDYYGDPYTGKDFVLASFSCDGSYRWAKVIGGGGVPIFPPHLTIDPNDNVYVAGRFANCDDDGYPPRIGTDTILDNFTQSHCKTLYLAKFAPDGELLWLKQPQEYGGQTQVLSHTSSLGLVSDENGNLYWFVLIPPGSYADSSFTNDQNVKARYIFKYSPEGQFLEAIPIDILTGQQPGSTWGAGFKFYRNSYNGHFYFTNTRIDPAEDSVIIGGQQVEHAFVLTSFNENGDFLWMRQDTTTDPFNGPRVYGLAFDADNNIYIGGKFSGFSHDSFMGFGVEEQILPSFVMKLDPTAENLLWASHSSGPGTPIGNGTPYGAITLYDGELIFTGGAAGLGYTWGTQTLDVNQQGGADVLLARFDINSGNCLELTHIQSAPAKNEIGDALAIDAAGDILVGGRFAYNLIDAYGNEVYSHGGETDFFLAKYATQACNPPLSVNTPDRAAPFKVYPNPVRARLSVKVSAQTAYRLYNLQGRLMLSGQLTPAHNGLSMQGLAPGVYFLKIKDGQGHKETVKVVKKR